MAVGCDRRPPARLVNRSRLAILSAIVALSTGSGCRAEANHLDVRLRGKTVKVYTYEPRNCRPAALLIVFHGALRHAASARDAAVKFARRHCMIVYAPQFSKAAFPNWKYQGGGIAVRDRIAAEEDWTVWFAGDLMQWARKASGQPRIPIYLFGHSAGAQYLSRVTAFAAPAEARRIVIANPSTYVLPSLTEAAPYGFSGAISENTAEARLRNYLSMPLTIFLGGADTGDEELATSVAAERQGADRLTRGKRTFELARQVAASRSWPFNWRVVITPGVGHDTSDMLNSPDADEAFGFRSDESPRSNGV